MFLRLLLTIAIFGCWPPVGMAEVPAAAKESVLGVRAYHPDGRVVVGSAVILGPGQLVTNAHIAHGARRIEVLQNRRALPATWVAHDSSRDLCLLEAPGINAPAMPWSSTAEAGNTVYAVGFDDKGRSAVTSGHLVALHDYDGAQVLQVSAPFDYGSSGGGLFDDQGRLLGVLTFKARAGGPFHFAMPVAWVGQISNRKETAGIPFWQRKGASLPYFLRAASFEATRDWRGLMALAIEWVQNDPSSRGASSALAKARLQRTNHILGLAN